MLCVYVCLVGFKEIIKNSKWKFHIRVEIMELLQINSPMLKLTGAIF